MLVYPSEELVEQVLQNIHSSPGRVLLLLSGGSQIGVIPDLFNAIRDSQIDLSSITVTVGDERYDRNPEHDESNFSKILQLPEAMELKKGGVTFAPILSKNTHLIDTGERFAGLVNSACDDDAVLTLAILGVGLDGHTAGIVPHDAEYTAMFYGTAAVGYEMEDVKATDSEFAARVTLTFSGISKLDRVFIYAPAEPKRDVLQKLVDQKKVPSTEQVAAKPCLFLSTLDDVALFTDLTLDV